MSLLMRCDSVFLRIRPYTTQHNAFLPYDSPFCHTENLIMHLSAFRRIQSVMTLPGHGAGVSCTNSILRAPNFSCIRNWESKSNRDSTRLEENPHLGTCFFSQAEPISRNHAAAAIWCRWRSPRQRPIWLHSSERWEKKMRGSVLSIERIVSRHSGKVAISSSKGDLWMVMTILEAC